MAAPDPKLYEAVLARPADDAPRLVLADALTEAGDPRGELIVVECMLAHRGLPPSERAQLRRRAAALRSELGARWADKVAGLGHWQMRRGFVDEVAASARDLLARRDVFATEPITRLMINDASAEDVTALAGTGVLSRVVRLTIRGYIGDDGARALAAALGARTAPLAALNVGSNDIGRDGARALAAALGGCRSLVLTGNPIGDEGLDAIAAAKGTASLETLFAAETEVGDHALRALARSSHVGSLVRLGIARNDDVTEDGLRALARSKKLKKLRWLEYTDPDEGTQRVVVRSAR